MNYKYCRVYGWPYLKERLNVATEFYQKATSMINELDLECSIFICCGYENKEYPFFLIAIDIDYYDVADSEISRAIDNFVSKIGKPDPQSIENPFWFHRIDTNAANILKANNVKLINGLLRDKERNIQYLAPRKWWHLFSNKSKYGKEAKTKLKTPYSDYSIITASIDGKTEAVKQFIEKGINLDLRDSDDCTPLMRASIKGHTEIVKLLLDKGASIDLISNDEATALLYASANGHKEVVKLLIDNGALVDVQSKGGLTPIMQALLLGHNEIVKLLLQKGANANLQASEGQSALMFAAEKGQIETMNILFDYGAKVDLQMNLGITALMIASANGKKEAVSLLLEKGANTEIKTTDEKLPLDFAKESEIKALLNRRKNNK